MQKSNVQWDESFRVGIDEVDNQHRKLFETVNNLIDATCNGSDTGNVEQLLNEMSDYVDYHFKTEQLYLEKHPDFNEHYLMHWDFTKKSMELQKEFREKRTLECGDLEKFLMHWLQDHVLNVDSKYFRELAELGLLV